MNNLRRQTTLSISTLWLTILIALSAPTASAHFLLNLNVRVIHVEHVADGANLYMRLPLPYLLADKVGETASSGELPTAARYTTNGIENGNLVHFVDFDRVAADPRGFGKIAKVATHIRSNGRSLEGEVKNVRVYRIGREPDFATLSEAQDAFAADFSAAGSDPLYVGDTVVDIQLYYPSEDPLNEYSISSSLNPGLPDQANTANLVLDYSPGKTQVFRSRGLLETPLFISHSTLDATATFVREGVIHILEGLDHVLFVLCLTLGASTLSALLWRATGFTVGHSITLSAGFLGLVPSGAWFVPFVETGIALSIVYVAWISIRKDNSSKAKSELSIFLGTCMLGLLHGLGFSFVLQEILRVNSPNIWQSLLAFNIGVELGQAIIILAIWPLLFLVRHWRGTWEATVRVSVATACAIVALVWTLDRGYHFVSTIVPAPADWAVQGSEDGQKFDPVAEK